MPLPKPCRSCGGPLGITLADFGYQPPSNALLDSAHHFQHEKFYPLEAAVCSKCYLVQLRYDVDPDDIFNDYVYFSSQSKSWVTHTRAYCEWAIQHFDLGSRSLVVEIASNDGHLLKNFCANDIPCYGVEPAANVAKVAVANGVPTEVCFFGKETAKKLRKKHGAANFIVANNVLAHVPDINDFVAGVRELLAENGTATFEFPHVLELLKNCEFDTIYHEHYSYLSLLALLPLFSKHGFSVYDVKKLPTHGGSLRVYVGFNRFAPGPVETVMREELAYGLDKASTYHQFAMRVAQCRSSFLGFMDYVQSSNKTIMGYGAAAKGNTFLNYCGVSPREIPLVGDTTPAKIGKFLPGTHIPVCTETELLLAQPDYVLILPWNWSDEIRHRLSAVVEYGGRFVTAIPETKIHNS